MGAMTNRISVSIIVPVYNVEKYLRTCIDSILAQTFRDFEVILVDDGSKDSSLQICREYAQNDKRIKVIHQENGRQTKARKTGLRQARGKYVYFVDSDDWLEPNLLDVAYKAAKKDNSDIVIFDSYFNYTNYQIPISQSIPAGVYDRQGLIKHVYPKMIYSGRFFYFGVYAAMWTKLMRRSIVVPNMMNVDERIRIGEDGVTSYAAMLDAQRVTVLKGQHLYHYRDNNVSITRSYYDGQFENVLMLIGALRGINDSKKVFNLNKQIDYYLMYNVHSIFYEEFYYKINKSYRDRIKTLKTIFNNQTVRQAANRIEITGMPRKSKCFLNAIKNNRFYLAISIAIYEAMIMRCKLLIKKLRKRY